MTKEESKILQGLAILLMLFLHLFNRNDNVALCYCLIYIGNEPIVHILTKACNPVAFFLLLSGYGLSYTYTHHGLSLKSQIKRLFKLYILYWICLLVFVTIGHFILPNKYPGSFSELLLNLTSYSYSYNEELWFLLPYVLVCITSPFLIKFFNKIGISKSFLLTWVGYLLMCYIIKKYGESGLFTNMLMYRPVLYIQFIFPFCLGHILQYFVETNHNLQIDIKYKQPIMITLLLVLIIAICSTWNTGWYPLYALFFILLFLNIKRYRFIDKTLYSLGKVCAAIWFIHTYFCYYLFKDYIYGLKYPILIFLVLVAVTYSCSVILCNLQNKIIKLLNL